MQTLAAAGTIYPQRPSFKTATYTRRPQLLHRNSTPSLGILAYETHEQARFA